MPSTSFRCVFVKNIILMEQKISIFLNHVFGKVKILCLNFNPPDLGSWYIFLFIRYFKNYPHFVPALVFKDQKHSELPLTMEMSDPV